MNKNNKSFRAIIFLLILALGAVFLYSGYRVLDGINRAKSPDAAEPTVSKTITKDGVKYFPRQDISVFMLIGIDQYGPVQESDSYNNSGEADMVALAIFDETDQTVRVLTLNRDTILEMPVLGLGGKPAGTATAQLALSHTYGSGLRDSCENTKAAVSNFLNGIEIDHYMALNMDAISMLNDAVGGVKVTVTDDFSAVDPTIPMGETVLNGKQALNFVQNRKGVGNQMNISRMERQKSYIKGFLSALKEKSKSASFIADTYGDIEEYMVTNTSAKGLSSTLSRYADYTLAEVISPEGENVTGGKYVEFHADKEKLSELTLRLFYAPK